LYTDTYFDYADFKNPVKKYLEGVFLENEPLVTKKMDIFFSLN